MLSSCVELHPDLASPPDRFSILLVCHSYPPLVGGSEVEAQRVSAELIRRGHRVQVVCAGGAPMPPLRDWVDPEGVPVRIYAGRWRGAMRDRVFAARVAGMLLRERNRYQIVYFLMQGLHLALGLPVARALRKPVVAKLAGSVVIPLMASSALGRLELRSLRRWADRLLILNENMADQAAARGFAHDQIEWMPNPVDTDLFAPVAAPERRRLRAELGLPSDAPIVIYCGRLAKEKALPDLLSAFQTVVKQHPEAFLVLAGDGPMRPELECQASELGLTGANLCFAGQVPSRAVPAWLQAADIFALVSPSEGFPCALAEAMACGLACIATDIPANRQLVSPGGTGLVVPVGDHRAIASAMARLIGEPGTRARLGQGARDLISTNFTPARIADRYDLLFRSILPPARARPLRAGIAGRT